MRRILKTALFTLLCQTAALGAFQEDWCIPEDFFFIDVFSGYRQDRFSWEISNPDANIKPLSKLTWKDLRIWEVGGNIKINCWEMFTIRCQGDWGKIYHGENTDSDYTYGQIKFLESKANAGKGEVFDILCGAGYDMACNNASILPLIGFSIHEQHLRLYDGVLVLNLISPDIGPFEGLDSSYDARWYGPWTGVEFIMLAPCDIDVFGGFAWHIARYHAKGHWNLREDIVGDFHHTAWGHGWDFSLGFNTSICQCWSLYLHGDYQFWWTVKGTDCSEVLEEEDGYLFQGHAVAPLESVKWSSWHVVLGLASVF